MNSCIHARSSPVTDRPGPDPCLPTCLQEKQGTLTHFSVRLKVAGSAPGAKNRQQKNRWRPLSTNFSPNI